MRFALTVEKPFTRRLRTRFAFQRLIQAEFDKALANREDRAWTTVERLAGLDITPVPPLRIDLQQHVGMLDLARSGFALIDQRHQRRPFILGEPNNILAHWKHLLRTGVTRWVYNEIYARLSGMLY